MEVKNGWGSRCGCVGGLESWKARCWHLKYSP